MPHENILKSNIERDVLKRRFNIHRFGDIRIHTPKKEKLFEIAMLLMKIG